MSEWKWERRRRKSWKRTNGMVVDGRSVFVIEQEISKQKRRRRRINPERLDKLR